jgi:SET family sugar efflux transporter-like MFS transporter
MALTSNQTARPLPRLLLGVLLLGVADSMVGPYLVLFGADQAHLSPFAIGVFTSLIAISGLAVSTWLGRRYDQAPSRTPALLAIAAPAAGYLLLTTTTSYALLLAIAVVFLGAGTAAFPQLFAIARSHLDRQTPAAATRHTPALRSVWSLAWAIGPMLGGGVLAWQGFTGLFLVAAAGFGLVALPVLLLSPPPAASRPGTIPSPEPTRPLRLLGPAALSFALFHTAMFSGSVALPLYVTQVLDRPGSDVGLLFSACAVVEITVALGLMLLPAHWSKQRVIVLGMGMFVAYFALVAASSSMPLLLLTQALRGAAIAVVGALGITYFQDLLPNSAGRATTLFSNTATAGSLVAGVVAGATAQALGYRAALLGCGILSAAASALLITQRTSTRTFSRATPARR